MPIMTDCETAVRVLVATFVDDPVPFLGVLPAAQRRGRGGRCSATGSRADIDTVPAYVEASSPRNRPLYERHGFCDTGAPIDLPDGPPLWPKWREPHR